MSKSYIKLFKIFVIVKKDLITNHLLHSLFYDVDVFYRRATSFIIFSCTFFIAIGAIADKAISANIFSEIDKVQFTKNKDSEVKSYFPEENIFVSGDILIENRSDYITDLKPPYRRRFPKKNSFFYLESNANLHLTDSLQIKTNWRLQPNAVINNRISAYPENYRRIITDDRRLQLDSTALILEELKLQFQHQDFKLSAGKIDPTFGTAHFNSNRIGVLTKDFTEDYNLREKIGVSVLLPLAYNQLKMAIFTNDNTKLSSSVIDRREENDNSTIASNNSKINSFSLSFLGANLLHHSNLSYNIGYRQQKVLKDPNTATENALTINVKSATKFFGEKAIYFAEIVKANNFFGEKDKKAFYSTLSLMVKYQKWQMGSTRIDRMIESKIMQYDRHDYQNQLNLGYDFNKKFTIDSTVAKIREYGVRANLIAFNIRYFNTFGN